MRPEGPDCAISQTWMAVDKLGHDDVYVTANEVWD
jgi:hypothetical protein